MEFHVSDFIRDLQGIMSIYVLALVAKLIKKYLK